jgi:ABC-2 type transport system ATP-binding protein
MAPYADAAIRVEDLRKTFGDLTALDGVTMTAEPGKVLGLLGPNGAGKTTIVRIVTTLLQPDSGQAWINGIDVVRDPQRARMSFGLAGQYPAVDENLTGFENLEMVGRLYRLSRRDARDRANELLERFDLADAGNRTAKTYSGGMRRRLDLAASIVSDAPILLLDEPTTGLDPRTRMGLWEHIRELVDSGVTLLLTTQYLEEADELADRIVVIDHGRIIAEGTSTQLKAQIGGDVIHLQFSERDVLHQSLQVLGQVGAADPQINEEELTLKIPARNGVEDLMAAVRLMDQHGIRPDDINIRKPSLDDVFLTLTGQPAEALEENGDDNSSATKQTTGAHHR